MPPPTAGIAQPLLRYFRFVDIRSPTANVGSNHAPVALRPKVYRCVYVCIICTTCGPMSGGNVPRRAPGRTGVVRQRCIAADAEAGNGASPCRVELIAGPEVGW